MLLQPGSQLGAYEIISPLGAGGMGEVYRARDTKLHRDIALKVLLPAMALDPARLERFTREARTVAALTHPNVVTIYSVEEVDGLHFITMELVNGDMLRDQIPASGIPADRFLEIAIALADALATAHEQGIIHRDLKPGNVMITVRGQLKVLDFGLAKMTRADESAVEETRLELTREGVLIGTIPYMSPEQIEGKPVDHRTDIFSLGVVLYEMATGSRPFTGESSATLMASILRDMPDNVAHVRPELPEALGRLIEQCLEKRRRYRVQSAREVHGALTSIQRDSTWAAGSPAQPRTDRRRKSDDFVTTGRGGAWIAVLPFMHRGTGADLDSLAEGLTDDVTTGLSRFRYLKVISRHATEPSETQTPDVRIMARRLGARYVLTGSLRKAGSMIRMGVELSDTDTGAHLWAETFDRDLGSTSIFTLQDQLADRIVATIADGSGAVVRSMARSLREAPPQNMAVDELIVRTLAYTQQFRVDEHAVLRDALEQALAREPLHADGWGALSILYGHEHMHGSNQRPDALDRHRRAAQQAVDLDPASQLGWGSLAPAFYFGRDDAAFRAAMERAISLNPRDGNRVALMGMLTAFLGDWPHGLEMVRRAMALNLQHPGWYHFVPFFDHYRKREFINALESLKRASMPNFHWTHLTTAAVSAQLGRHAEAEKSLEVLQRASVEAFDADRIRAGFSHWLRDAELIDLMMDGLRKAGLPMHDAVEGRHERGSPTRARGDAAPSIAVLPFANMSGDPSYEYFGDGMAEEVLNVLTRIEGLKVIARASAFAFKGKAGDIRNIAETLGVETILDGSIRRSEDRVRIAVQLVSAQDGSHLWSERYDREMTDIFALQDEIARAVASALDVVLKPRPLTVGTAREPANPAAYEAYLAGQHLLLEATPQSIAQAIESFELALQLDPQFALPHVGLAVCHLQEAAFLNVSPHTAMPKVLAAAERAIEMNPSLADAYVVRAEVRGLYQYDWKGALDDAERAISLNPALAGAHRALAAADLQHQGTRTRTAMRRAAELDPINPHVRMQEVWILAALGDVEESVTKARSVVQLLGGLWTVRYGAGVVLLAAGLLDEAATVIQVGLQADPDHPSLLAVLAAIEGRRGRQTVAEQICTQLRELTEAGHLKLLDRAIADEGAGDLVGMYALLNRAIDEREPLIPPFLSIRRPALESDPRFRQLLVRTHLVGR